MNLFLPLGWLQLCFVLSWRKNICLYFLIDRTHSYALSSILKMCKKTQTIYVSHFACKLCYIVNIRIFNIQMEFLRTPFSVRHSLEVLSHWLWVPSNSLSYFNLISGLTFLLDLYSMVLGFLNSLGYLMTGIATLLENKI